MMCPTCAGATSVVDSRPSVAGVRRRRDCATCAVRFTTRELPEADLDRIQDKLAQMRVTVELHAAAYLDEVAALIRTRHKA